MRAKEYLELNKKEIYHYETVKKSIYELYPLRGNKRNTEDYFNKHLFADVRFMQTIYCTGEEKAGDTFEELEDEVSNMHALRVRQEILNAIADDETFIYAFNIIVMEKNCYYNYYKSNICKPREVNCNTQSMIKEKITLYKEDYPKPNLADYMIDDENRYFLEQYKIDLNHDEKWWLIVFNNAYEIFDQVRIKLYNPFEAKNIVLNYSNDDEDLQKAVINLINYLIGKYLYDLTTEQQKKIKILSDIIKNHYENEKNCMNYKDKILMLEEENKRMENELKEYKNENMKLEKSIYELENEDTDTGMTTSQLSITFNYLFNKMGLNFSNSDKTSWARFISKVSGKSYERTRRSLNIDYDDKNTQKNIRMISEYFSELFPEIEVLMLNDIK